MPRSINASITLAFFSLIEHSLFFRQVSLSMSTTRKRGDLFLFKRNNQLVRVKVAPNARQTPTAATTIENRGQKFRVRIIYDFTMVHGLILIAYINHRKVKTEAKGTLSLLLTLFNLHSTKLFPLSKKKTFRCPLRKTLVQSGLHCPMQDAKQFGVVSIKE